MSAPKKRTAKATARHDANRQANETAAARNEVAVRLTPRSGGEKRPSKLVRLADRAQKRHEDAERLAAAFRRDPEGGDAA